MTCKYNDKKEDNNNETRCGGFVKRESTSGGKQRWVKVDDNFVRDKIGQSLRDSLHDQYRSSTKAKQSRRTKVNEKVDIDLQQVIHSNAEVSRRIQKLCKDIKNQQQKESVSEKTISSILCRANLDILEQIKKDGSLLTKFQDATNNAHEHAD